jgi:hypothetical protein
MMASENNEFKERKEFNPVLRAVSKWLFGMKRYTIIIPAIEYFSFYAA